MNRLTTFLGLAVLITAAGSCTDKDGNPIDPIQQLCGFSCPGDTVSGIKIGGVAEGNASITGVPSVDAFFSATIAFQTAANSVSDGIQAELDLIKADFGITGDLSTGLKDAFDKNLQAGVKFEYQPPKCAVDAQASLEASAKCDVMASGGKVEVECKGSCEAELRADFKCDASADLYCTVTAPEVKCEGECSGSCTAEVGAQLDCSGTCRGECDGECNVTTDEAGTQCAGTCKGMCKGSCETQLTAAAECMGTCRGECTAKAPEAGCTGGIKAECRGKADASFKCSGRCDGTFEPPMVSAECKASAKAQASVNIECTPPRLGLTYAFASGATPEFKAAFTSLVEVRLPALAQAKSKAKLIWNAGEDLGVAADTAVKAAVAKLSGQTKLKVLYGLKCGTEQLPEAQKIIDASLAEVDGKFDAAGKVTAMLGLGDA